MVGSPNDVLGCPNIATYLINMHACTYTCNVCTYACVYTCLCFYSVMFIELSLVDGLFMYIGIIELSVNYTSRTTINSYDTSLYDNIYIHVKFI